MQLKQLFGKLINECDVKSEDKIKLVNHSGVDYAILVTDYRKFSTLTAEVVNNSVTQYYAISFNSSGETYIYTRRRSPSAKTVGKLQWTDEYARVNTVFNADTPKSEIIYSIIGYKDFEYETFKLKSLNEEV